MNKCFNLGNFLVMMCILFEYILVYYLKILGSSIKKNVQLEFLMTNVLILTDLVWSYLQ